MNNELEKRWNAATNPNAHELEGWYKVDILSGFGWFAGFFVKRWLKVLRTHNGNNCIDGKKEGSFLLHQNPDCVILNYNLPQNNSSWRRVLDFVRQESDGVLLGKLHIRFWNGFGLIKLFAGYRFQGFFTLTKTELEVKHVPND